VVTKRARTKPGVENDWGKTRPFWCLACGIGFYAPRLVREHCETAGHTNESNSIGFKGLNVKEQMMAFKLRNK